MQNAQTNRVWMAIMLLLLVYTAPDWLDASKRTSPGYDAPWVYPGLLPPNSQ